MRTRIIIGLILTALAVGMFLVDHQIGAYAPCLFVVSVGLALLGSLEFCRMIPAQRRPLPALCAGGAMGLVLVHWVPFLAPSTIQDGLMLSFHAWIIFILIAMLVAIATYRGPGEELNRLALALFVVAYVGLLAGFLIELRVSQSSPAFGTASLLLAVFVPKACDIGAYFTGSFIGRHKMSPVLSPKKTWEGAAGGLVAAIAVALLIQSRVAVIPGGFPGAIAFGFVIGLAGMMGDMAESLIKRDLGTKDASQALPEYGGVLDIVDSILFTAPLTYWWLRWT